MDEERANPAGEVIENKQRKKERDSEFRNHTKSVTPAQSHLLILSSSPVKSSFHAFRSPTVPLLLNYGLRQYPEVSPCQFLHNFWVSDYSAVCLRCPDSGF